MSDPSVDEAIRASFADLRAAELRGVAPPGVVAAHRTVRQRRYLRASAAGGLTALVLFGAGTVAASWPSGADSGSRGLSPAGQPAGETPAPSADPLTPDGLDKLVEAALAVFLGVGTGADIHLLPNPTGPVDPAILLSSEVGPAPGTYQLAMTCGGGGYATIMVQAGGDPAVATARCGGTGEEITAGLAATGLELADLAELDISVADSGPGEVLSVAVALAQPAGDPAEVLPLMRPEAALHALWPGVEPLSSGTDSFLDFNRGVTELRFLEPGSYRIAVSCEAEQGTVAVTVEVAETVAETGDRHTATSRCATTIDEIAAGAGEVTFEIEGERGAYHVSAQADDAAEAVLAGGEPVLVGTMVVIVE